ncbi:unnamed protein product [Taenia asiatica]|uniref:Protein-tyrosine phosphatase n=1 Tax=Taenia asiatica TaxID=60517 RepID=A0A0R3VXP6_TAEAS|nr:unnamed protein product [Taenia asiatica]
MLQYHPAPYLANYLGDDAIDDQVTDTGDAPPRPPKSTAFTESRNSLRNASPTGVWVSSSSPPQRLDVSPSNHHYHRCQPQQPQHQQQLQMGPPSILSKPRINSYGTVRDKSFTGMDDHTRVKIVGADGDYINASFIEMAIPKAALRKYIASQGPLKTTCADFWQMCWEHDSELIVMLTDVGEQGREKCHKYWPNKNETIEFTWTQPKSSQAATSSSEKCVQLRISNVKEEEKGNTAYREFQVQRTVISVKDATAAGLSLKPSKPSITSFSREKGPSIVNGAEVRRIVQLQYLRWPDHGVPSNCDDLIAFVERMRELRARGKSTCAVVHCSAGIGRTGVVILLDTAMDMIRAQSPVKPIEMVRGMRMFRKRLVQTPTQFQFVCEAIVKYHAGKLNFFHLFQFFQP